MTAKEKVLEIAKNEVGYLEKKSRKDLYSKTGNAGSGNFTKYWEDILPSFQGQPWCAALVTWLFAKAFGKEGAKKLLGHYPYTYVPTLANMHTRYANPEPLDVVCFYRNGSFVHTGIVTKVNGDYFETIEGNTSGGNGIVANGGGVFEKSYYNSQLPGTKFIRPNYSLVEEEVKELTTINDIVWELGYRGIVSDKEGMMNAMSDEPNGRLYWLARKAVQYIREKEMGL